MKKRRRPPAPGGQRGHRRRGVKASKTEQHYKTHFVTAVRDDNAQEHSLSLVEYPEAIRFRKKEKKISIRGGRAGPPGPGPDERHQWRSAAKPQTKHIRNLISSG